MKVDFKTYFVPAPSAVIEKLKEAGIEIEGTEKPSLFDVVMFLQQTFGLMVNVNVYDIDDAIDNPYFYKLHYINRNGVRSLDAYQTVANDNGFATVTGALTIGIIDIINAGLQLNLFK